MSATRDTLVTWGLAVLASVAVTATTYAYVLEQPRTVVAAPVGLLVAAGLLALALARFEVFVVAVLATRTTLDALKLAGAAVPDPAALLGILFGGVALVWLIATTRRGDAAPFSQLSRAAIVFGAVAFLGVLTSPQPAESLVEWSRLCSMLLMLLVVEQLARRPRWRRHCLAAIALAAVVPLVVAAHQLATSSNLFSAGGFDRIRGTFMHSNPLAAFLAVLVVLAAAVLVNGQDRRHRSLAVVVLVPALTGLYLTYTRAAWLAALVGVVVVAVVHSRRTLLPLVAAAFLVVLLVPGVGQRFADLAVSETPRGEPGNSLTWRLHYWTSALDLAKESPVSGIGLKQVAAQQEESKQPHNDFVRVYVELGIAGLVAYGYLLWQYAVTAVRSVRRARTLGPGVDRAVLVGFAGVAVGFLLMSLVMNLLTQVVVGIYLYAVAGLAVAVLRSAGGPGPGAEPDADVPADLVERST